MPATRTLSARRQRTLVPVLLSLGMLMAIISSLGAPLIPSIAAVEQVSPSSAQWSLTVTMLVGAVATPTMGRLGDGPHRRRVILIGLVVVLVGSVLAALPLGFACLIAGRALQGVGIGLTPLAMAAARDALPAERAQSAVATLSLTSAAGVGLGYPITGLLAEYFGLSSGFWFAAIATTATLIAIAAVLPQSPQQQSQPLDVVGAAVLTLGLGGLLLAITQSEHWGWTSPQLLSIGAVSVLLLVGWGVHELRTPHPLVDLRMLKRRMVLAADLNGVLSGVGNYLLLSTVSRFVQAPSSTGYGFGATVVVAGLVLVPYSAASLLAGRLAPRLARGVPLSRLLPLGCVIALLGMVCFVLARGSLWQIFLVMGVTGLGIGFSIAVMPALIVSAVPEGETGSAMSFNQVLKYVGYSLGSALSAVALQPAGNAAMPSNGDYQTAGLLGCGMWIATALVSHFLTRRPRRPGFRTGGDSAAAANAGTNAAGASAVSSGHPQERARGTTHRRTPEREEEPQRLEADW